jgi:hypothetical protein
MMGISLKFIYPNVKKETNITIYLNDVLEYKTEIELCGAERMTTYRKDGIGGYVQLSDTNSTHLEENPTVINMTTGEFKPYLKTRFGPGTFYKNP